MNNEPAYQDDLRTADACAAGVGAAQTDIFNRHYKMVFQICFKILHDRETAEDVAQETFIHIFRKISSYKGNSRLKTWIYRVAVNQSLMYRRRCLKNRTESLTPDPDGGGKPAEPRAAGSVADTDNRMLLEKSIAALPDGYRRTFILCAVEGYECRETAEIMGCSEGNVKSQMFKARARLRKLINRKTNSRIVFS